MKYRFLLYDIPYPYSFVIYVRILVRDVLNDNNEIFQNSVKMTKNSKVSKPNINFSYHMITKDWETLNSVEIIHPMINLYCLECRFSDKIIVHLIEDLFTLVILSVIDFKN